MDGLRAARGRRPRKPDAKRKRDSAQPQERAKRYRACASRHPVRAKSEGEHFLHGASIPPLRGGEREPYG